MGVMRRIADAARTTWERKMRIGEKPLSELTDKELEAELVRRRRMRAGRGGAANAEPSAEASGARAAVQRANVRQWYANLELAPGQAPCGHRSRAWAARGVRGPARIPERVTEPVA